MELQREHLSPDLTELVLRVGNAVTLSQRQPQLDLAQQNFQLAVVALVARLRGVRATMVFKVQLARPLRQILASGNALFQILEEVQRESLAHGGAAGHRALHAAGVFDHPVGASAAAVAVAVGHDVMVVQPLLLETLPAALDLVRFEHGVIGGEEGQIVVALIVVLAAVFAGGRKVGEHLASVDALPREGIIRRAVEFRPGQLAGHEVVDAALFQNLRQRGGIAEHVGQPQDAAAAAELGLKEFVAVQELPDQRLAAGQVAVGLDPHAALGLPLAALHGFPDALEQLRLILLDELIQLRLRGHELELGILLHQAQHRGEGAHGLMARLIQIPQPRHVDMGVADAVRDGLRLAAFQRLIVVVLQIVARRLDGGVERGAERLAQIEQVDRVGQRAQRGFALAAALAQKQRGGVRHVQIVIKLGHVVHAVGKEERHARRVHARGDFLGAVVGLQEDVVFPARHGHLVQNQLGVTGVERLRDLAVHPHDDLRVHGFPLVLHAAADGKDGLTPEILRRHDGETEILPVVAHLFRPQRAVFKRRERVFSARRGFDSGDRHAPAHAQVVQIRLDFAHTRVQLVHLHRWFTPLIVLWFPNQFCP